MHQHKKTTRAEARKIAQASRAKRILRLLKEGAEYQHKAWVIQDRIVSMLHGDEEKELAANDVISDLFLQRHVFDVALTTEHAMDVLHAQPPDPQVLKRLEEALSNRKAANEHGAVSAQNLT